METSAPTQPAAAPAVAAAARDLLGHYSLPGGTECGGFRAKLFSLWASADHRNRALLADVFPVEGTVIAALNAPGQDGIEAVRRLAGLPADLS